MVDNEADAGSLEPPPLASEATAIKIGMFGGLLAAVAIMVGAPTFSESAQGTVALVRALLSIVGMIVAGTAISLRYRCWSVWLTAAGACLLASFGLPASWYTIRLLAWVLTGVATVGAILVWLPFGWRMTVVSAMLVFHFMGIFTAVTTPPPTPPLTYFIWTVVFRPYLQFAYLNNAYQFYSPDPGPASELWFCIYYKPAPDDPVKMEVLRELGTGEPARDKDGQLIYDPMLGENGEAGGEPIYDAAGNLIFQERRDSHGNVLKKPVYRDPDEQQKPDYLETVRWIKLPKRDRDYKDPLGQTYYRRLSLTEQVVHSTPFNDLPLDMQQELMRRRQALASEIPLDSKEGNVSPCQIPSADAAEIVLPAYVRHIARLNGHVGSREIESIRVYRVTHKITPPAFLNTGKRGQTQGVNLRDPTTYLPFYMGRFTPEGEIMDPADPMLYWLVPIRRNPNANLKDFEKLSHREMKLSDYKRLYDDYVYKHAGSHHMEGELAK